MTRHEFLRLVEEAVEATPGTISGDETLVNVGWDSLGTVSFLALVDEKFARPVEPEALARCQTVADLVALMGDQVTG